MKKLVTLAIALFLTVTSAQATNDTFKVGEKFSDLTYDYFYGKNKVSSEVKKVIAAHEQTSPRILKILSHDTDNSVSTIAKQTLFSQLTKQQ